MNANYVPNIKNLIVIVGSFLLFCKMFAMQIIKNERQKIVSKLLKITYEN